MIMQTPLFTFPLASNIKAASLPCLSQEVLTTAQHAYLLTLLQSAQLYQYAIIQTLSAGSLLLNRHSSVLHKIWHMIQTSDLWPCKPCQQSPLTWWISVTSFIERNPSTFKHQLESYLFHIWWVEQNHCCGTSVILALHIKLLTYIH